MVGAEDAVPVGEEFGEQSAEHFKSLLVHRSRWTSELLVALLAVESSCYRMRRSAAGITVVEVRRSRLEATPLAVDGQS